MYTRPVGSQTDCRVQQTWMASHSCAVKRMTVFSIGGRAMQMGLCSWPRLSLCTMQAGYAGVPRQAVATPWGGTARNTPAGSALSAFPLSYLCRECTRDRAIRCRHQTRSNLKKRWLVWFPIRPLDEGYWAVPVIQLGRFQFLGVSLYHANVSPSSPHVQRSGRCPGLYGDTGKGTSEGVG